MRSLKNTLVTFALATLAGASMSTRAAAQVEVEVDPIAYALRWYSVHVAKVLGRTRLDAGAFGLQVPSSLHGNDGWTSSMRGVGIKWDYIGGSSDGFFAGLDGGYARGAYKLDAAGVTERRGIIGLGVRGGYRYTFGQSRVFVSPWASVSYNINGDDVRVGSATFKRNTIELFPTVHLGWRF